MMVVTILITGISITVLGIRKSHIYLPTYLHIRMDTRDHVEKEKKRAEKAIRYFRPASVWASLCAKLRHGQLTC